jgi:hypothetical protein
MEKRIEKHKHDLLNNGTPGHWDPDNDHEVFWETEGGPVKEEDESLDDGDLAYINAILNSFSKTKFHGENSCDPELPIFTPEGALTHASAAMMTPPKFNQKFNQNSTSYGPEADNFSYFSSFEEEGPTDLADYFSDEEEDDSLDNEDLSSESDPWSQPDFSEFEDFSNRKHSPSKLDTTTFGLKSISETDFKNQEEANYFDGISSLSEKNEVAFSAWQPFIPQEHAFQNFAAQWWPSDSSQQPSSSQEPTLIQISTITGPRITTKPTRTLIQQTTPETSHSQLKDWLPSRPATRPYTHTWMKPWPEFSETYNRARNLHKESPDRPERSKQYRPWKQPLPCSPRMTLNQNTRRQNTPQVTDVGNEHQVCIQSQLRIYLSTKSEINTTRIKSWGTKWHKFYTKTPTYRTKLQKSTKCHLKSSRRTPLWLWSRRQYPPICSLDTARTEKQTLNQKISPRGENHFSKRSSESESYSKYKSINSKSESKDVEVKYSKYKSINSKSESKDVEVKNEHKLVTFSTEVKAKVKAKADEVKAIRKTQAESRMEIEKQLDKNTGSYVPATLPPPFATPFNISVSICICVTFTYFIFISNIFILILNSFLSDPMDHHFQTFTSGDLSDCEVLCLSRKTASMQATTAVNALTKPDSIQPFRIPEIRPNLPYRKLHKNTLVPNHLFSLGQTRKSENHPCNDSFILIYLDLSR